MNHPRKGPADSNEGENGNRCNSLPHVPTDLPLARETEYSALCDTYRMYTCYPMHLLSPTPYSQENFFNT